MEVILVRLEKYLHIAGVNAGQEAAASKIIEMTDTTRLVDGYRTAFIDSSYKSDPEFCPQFITNNQGRKVISTISRELRGCDSALISVAFITKGGIEALKGDFKELEKKGTPIRILTTDYLMFSEPDALDLLDSLDNVSLRLFQTSDDGPGFHTKGYLFYQKENVKILIGSSNLTHNAITRNHEWNTKIVSSEKGQFAIDIASEFEDLWNKSADYAECRDGYRERYKDKLAEKRKLDVLIREMSFKGSRLVPNPMQTSFSQNIERLVSEGERRALLISATGTGKTYASAFGVRNLFEKEMLSKRDRVLFLSHREQINIQALKSYRRVFGPGLRMELLSGTHHDIEMVKSASFVFSTMQTMSKSDCLSQFSSDYFSVIILDECHRTGAESYQRIIDYFEPKLLLGMSASPERGDGFDVFGLFHHNIACEIRLKQALENDLLCPFHYFGISDLVLEGKEDVCIDFNRLTSEDRVSHILTNAEYYGYSGDVVKGLIFCSSIIEAKELSNRINERRKKDGSLYRTLALSGADRQDVRAEAVSSIVRGDLDYILTVDIFNEGVDIPEINQVIMLRPTESPIIFVQQLGRGLRKAEDKEFVVVIDFIGNYENNYMIPIALSGDTTGNKDNIRKSLFVGNDYISGASTIYFDEISRRRIFESIDSARVNEAGKIKREYLNLKQMLGHIPSLCEFDEYNAMDPLRINANDNAYKSYYDFLVRADKEYQVRLSKEQEQMIMFLFQKLASGKRPHELELLNIILNEDYCSLSEVWVANMQSKYGIVMDRFAIRTSINVLSHRFYNVGASAKTFEKCIFVAEDTKALAPAEGFLRNLHDDDFRTMLTDLVRFGLKRFERDYSRQSSENSFVHQMKYSYDDVCRLLNWEQNAVALNIGGYKYDAATKTFAVFINYEKADDIQDSIKYEDRFLSPSRLIALSKNKRTLESNEIKRIQDPETRIELFVRKNKDDEGSKEFYYLGRLHCDKDHLREILNSQRQSMVEIGYRLETPVPTGLYEYLISNAV